MACRRFVARVLHTSWLSLQSRMVSHHQMPPNHALQRTAAGRRSCNRRARGAVAELGSLAGAGRQADRARPHDLQPLAVTVAPLSGGNWPLFGVRVTDDAKVYRCRRDVRSWHLAPVVA